MSRQDDDLAPLRKDLRKMRRDARLTFADWMGVAVGGVLLLLCIGLMLRVSQGWGF